MKTKITKLVVKDVMPVFVVWTNTDLTEGRGREYPMTVCKRMATAKRLAKGRYVMGTDCHITEDKAYLTDTGWYMLGGLTYPTPEDEMEEAKIAEAKLAAEKFDAAIAKAKMLGLTDAEIENLRNGKP